MVSADPTEAIAMGILADLSALAVRQLVDGACQVIHFKAGSEVVDRLTAFLHKHFTDHSRKLTAALNKANGRAWQALEQSLASESWWARCQVMLAPAEARTFKQQVDVFFDKLPLTEAADRAERFAPFPLSKYEPERILGAGGFGVAFLCRHCNLGSQIVVKALRLDDQERDVLDVFREARVLEELSHPSIIYPPARLRLRRRGPVTPLPGHGLLRRPKPGRTRRAEGAAAARRGAAAGPAGGSGTARDPRGGKKFFLKLPRPGSYEVRLHYDKVWANLADRLDVQYLG
jgi:hypothetical protein